MLLGVQAALGALAVAWGLVRGLPWWQRVELSPDVFMGLAAGGALSLISNAAFRVLAHHRLARSEWLLDEFLGPLFRGLPFRWAVALALLSAWCEEAFFRGVLQAEFGLWIATALFGVLHTGDRRLLLAGAWSTLVGLGLGFAYEITGNLAVPMAIHGASNFLSFLDLARWSPKGE